MELGGEYLQTFFHLGEYAQNIYAGGINRLRASKSPLENLVIVREMIDAFGKIIPLSTRDNYLALRELLVFNKIIGTLLENICFELKWEVESVEFERKRQKAMEGL